MTNFSGVEKGKGEVVIDGKRTKIKGDGAFCLPAGARHNVINTDHKPLRLLYPPAHLSTATPLLLLPRQMLKHRRSTSTARLPE